MSDRKRTDSINSKISYAHVGPSGCWLHYFHNNLVNIGLRFTKPPLATARAASCNGPAHLSVGKIQQVGLLSQRGRAMLHVIEYLSFEMALLSRARVSLF